MTVISTGQRNIYTLALEREMLKMKQRPRIYYSSEQRNLMWDRWQKGDSMHVIARLFDRGHSSVQRILSATGAYVHGNEVAQDWRLHCRNVKRSLAALCQDSRSVALHYYWDVRHRP